jgi:hypothetical protein
MSMMIMSSTFELIWLSSTSFVTKDVDDDDEFGIGTHLTFIYIFHLLQFIVPKTVRPVAPPVKVLADVYVDFRGGPTAYPDGIPWTLHRHDALSGPHNENHCLCPEHAHTCLRKNGTKLITCWTFCNPAVMMAMATGMAGVA